MAIYLTELGKAFTFPSPYKALSDPNGLLAFGGDLDPMRILKGYHQGIFPWYGPGEPILWWSPSPRAVFDPSTFKPSKSLRKFQRKHDYQVTLNQATQNVIQLCSSTRPESETWLNEDMQTAYIELAELGHCHSVEVWHEDELIGGLYGLSVGQVFCGESMFSLKDNASKVALWYLCHHLKSNQGQLIDCQVMNSHLASLGAFELDRDEFMQKLLSLREKQMASGTFEPQVLRNSAS
ncbi:leucyl/phenylalanyl-tRNA--protein transferase [Vibrio natriegens]|uniref:Leucyl/phenylalanyl-tRNA--protein transferase n=1 Tax=Vibrio natriegens NBRC 15636 = ATCC 14048 = DSM 759 TaxID=1219067 RepID=A0AAN0Y1K0_VIBNA|nr:leucyl/phenylalanyl-tRNA--protein transferase [Vibrio natriegens]ALR15992.1 leucyl/phenylalanyl-tRNA--protein transferase [Vibrio natriegens NBRC 15636 = ATCC 14048 = DSM 759]ANQ12146.1 leucyl/phenylalanyl-tRNA--protein transferase [Vibrio natriegens NBRC 15636 = ATCC 14048 = DSM 759]EPM42620.1 leucyl/phenylalanyl-tRNA--protein transferase [Vibrio natriegens NBRC 15636 = ATCC 14048 = DSM 759]MDX6026509.1 leucyl/phenylalanyl-tRNA--protein transferase [Vibrio natriegens NBRC 15636 = ATCC 14048